MFRGRQCLVSTRVAVRFGFGFGYSIIPFARRLISCAAFVTREAVDRETDCASQGSVGSRPDTGRMVLPGGTGGCMSGKTSFDPTNST